MCWQVITGPYVGISQQYHSSAFEVFWPLPPQPEYLLCFAHTGAWTSNPLLLSPVHYRLCCLLKRKETATFYVHLPPLKTASGTTFGFSILQHHRRSCSSPSDQLCNWSSLTSSGLHLTYSSGSHTACVDGTQTVCSCCHFTRHFYSGPYITWWHFGGPQVFARVTSAP